MKIPFVDLHAQYLSIRPAIDAAIADVIAQTAFIGGRHVTDFEAAFARKLGVKHAIGCANGTDAIYVALRMMGIGPGDEVITTAHSWISTSEAIGQTGALPVFVDVDAYHAIDVDAIEAAITPRTRALVPVHLYGQPANMERVMAVASKHGLRVLEDCAQSHLATFDGQMAGTFGDVATFSFYPGKNLGAYGDAGAIVTSDDALAERMRMYANHGQLRKHDHRMEGINSRLDSLHAAVLSAKLPHLDAWTQARQRVAGWYRRYLEGIAGVQLPLLRERTTHVYHLFVVQVDDRDGLSAALRDKGVQSAVHYPTPLPLLQAYADRGFTAQMFPRAARSQSRILSLPMFPEMTEEMVGYVASIVADFVRGK